MFDGLRDWLKCFHSHDYRADRAVDLVENGAVRYHRDGVEEPIDACDIIDKCTRCGNERRVYSPISIAEKHDIPLEWEGELW